MLSDHASVPFACGYLHAVAKRLFAHPNVNGKVPLSIQQSEILTVSTKELDSGDYWPTLMLTVALILSAIECIPPKHASGIITEMIDQIHEVASRYKQC